MSGPAGHPQREKLAELRRISSPGRGFEVVGLEDVPEFPEAPETGATFEENALAKARDAAAATGLPAVADDSGLAVDALNGMPGVLSARWSAGGARTERDAEPGAVLDQWPTSPTSAAARPSSARRRSPAPAAARSSSRALAGTLIRKPRGTNGFGYDPIVRARRASRAPRRSWRRRRRTRSPTARRPCGRCCPGCRSWAST